MDDRALIVGVADWLPREDQAHKTAGLESLEAEEKAAALLERLKAGDRGVPEEPLTDSGIDVLRAATRLLASRPDAESFLKSGDLLFNYVSNSAWRQPDFEERAELLWECALSGWLVVRTTGQAGATARWKSRLASTLPLLGALGEAMRVNAFSDVSPQAQLEGMMGLALWIESLLETSPQEVRTLSSDFYRRLASQAGGNCSLEGRAYFLGETARIAGTACRFLGLRDEARRWFDRAESAFRHTMNPVAEWSRVAYQRLALQTEEREFDEVFELAPRLIQTFQKLEMPEDALRCRFLEAGALKETERYAEACASYREICRDAEALGSRKLLGTARCSLVQLHSFLGDTNEAIAESHRALPILQEEKNRVGIAKLHWGLGYLLRDKGDLPAAIETFRAAQTEFTEIGMRADIAAIQLVIADLLLDSGHEQQAEREILSALPVIEELKMVPEGMAAMTLLRESLRQRSINRQALRDLHGFFEEL